jgi:hypothetical protein
VRTLRAAVGAGANASGQMHGNGCERVRPGTDGWDWPQTLGADGWDRARTRGAYTWNWVQTPRVHGATGTNTRSVRGQKANRAQPLQSRHVSGCGRVRHQGWA